jgi:amidase/aspartyl-tRNA(Asn)/glutamyl-tRNA(Gln) amidotransferase subunit A
MIRRTTPLDDAPELCRLNAAALTRGYASGAFSPVEVTRAALARAEHVQAGFNAFTHLDHAGALAAATESEKRWRDGAARGPLDGVPATIKDILLVRGWTIRYGTRAVPGIDATEDAPAVGQLRAAGALLLGLTTTPEFGWKAVTDSPATGITRNPWDKSRTPGGSSGGAAVAAACGAGVLHYGTDGGGSIRIPSSFTGIVGLKPTFGRVAAYPASPFGTVAHHGPMARTVADVALMLDAMSGRDLRDFNQNPFPFSPASPVAPRALRGLRLGVWDRPPRGTVAPDVMAAFRAALAWLEGEGAILAPVALPEEDLFALFADHWHVGAAVRVHSIPADRHELMEAGLRDVAADGARRSGLDVILAHRRRATWGAAFDALLAEHDAIVSPGVQVGAFAAGGEVPPGSGLDRWTEWAGFSYPVNLAQSPACVLRCGFEANGMPVGLQVIGRRGDDAGVLATAAALEGLFSD